jgi:hypothetical protein
MPKSNRFLSLASALSTLILVVVVGLYAWMYLLNPCDEGAVREATAYLTTQLRAYDDLYQFTTTVYRGGIGPPLYKLQQIYMNTQAVAVPICMQRAKQDLLDYMRTVILAFESFAVGEADTTIRDLVDQSNRQYDKFRSELRAVNECAPFCLR